MRHEKSHPASCEVAEGSGRTAGPKSCATRAAKGASGSASTMKWASLARLSTLTPDPHARQFGVAIDQLVLQRTRDVERQQTENSERQDLVRVLP